VNVVVRTDRPRLRRNATTHLHRLTALLFDPTTMQHRPELLTVEQVRDRLDETIATPPL
jgi:hypothetical protein